MTPIGKLIIERTQLSNVSRTLREARTTIRVIISCAFIFVLRSTPFVMFVQLLIYL